MKYFCLAALSSTLLFASISAHADNERVTFENKSIQLFSKATITTNETKQYLNQFFNVDSSTLAKDANIIHSQYILHEMEGMPYAFTFNQGSQVIGIAGAIEDTESKAFFQKLAKVPNLTCSTKKSRFYDLKVCSHKTAQPAIVNKFTKDFIYLMENAG